VDPEGLNQVPCKGGVILMWFESRELSKSRVKRGRWN